MSKLFGWFGKNKKANKQKAQENQDQKSVDQSAVLPDESQTSDAEQPPSTAAPVVKDTAAPVVKDTAGSDLSEDANSASIDPAQSDLAESAAPVANEPVSVPVEKEDAAPVGVVPDKLDAVEIADEASSPASVNDGENAEKSLETPFQELESKQDLAQLIEQFNNKYVRKGQIVKDTSRHTAMLIRWIKLRFGKEINKRKSERGKTTQRDKLSATLEFFSDKNKANLIKMFELQKLMVLAKLKLINRLNQLSMTKAFVKTKNGFKTVGAEGYVAIDKLGGDAVKIVDRMEFSYNNFSPNVVKGWEKAGK